MQNLDRESILRIFGLHDASSIARQINAIQLSLEEQDGQMTTFWTEIRKDEKQISLIAGRMDTAETNIGQLQVTAQNLTASVTSLNTTVSGHTTKIGQLEITANSLTASVSSLDSTVSGHTTSIGQLQVTANSISNRVTVIEGDYVKNAQISLMVVKDGNGYISNALIDADDIKFVFSRAVSWYWQSETEDNKRMGLDSSGNLWISGDFKGGQISQNVTLGSTSSDALYKIELYTDERITSSLPWLSSGIRGVLNSTVYMDIGFAGVGGTTAYPKISLNNGKTGSNLYYSSLNCDRLVFGTSSTNRMIIGYPQETGKIYIHLNYSDLYKESDLSSIYKGDVYVDNSGYLRIKNT